MRIFMTGGTGFVGQHLAPAMVREGHRVTVLTRIAKEKGKKEESAGISFVQGDPNQKGPWQAAVKQHEAVINFAGASIFARWTEDAKKIIRNSRLLTTRHLVEAIPGGEVKVFFSTSAIGYYGFHEDEILTEESPPGEGFLAQLAQDWEKEALAAQEVGCRVVLTRFGIILGEKGGALGQMISLFKKYLGGPLGDGKQWFSWIHIRDLIQAFLFLLTHSEVSGPVNFTSPNPIRNNTLAKALGEALGRPSFLPAPGFMLKLILGEFGSVLLKGQRVIPKKLLDRGFSFQFPEIDRALKQVIQGPPIL